MCGNGSRCLHSRERQQAANKISHWADRASRSNSGQHPQLVGRVSNPDILPTHQHLRWKWAHVRATAPLHSHDLFMCGSQLATLRAHAAHTQHNTQHTKHNTQHTTHNTHPKHANTQTHKHTNHTEHTKHKTHKSHRAHKTQNTHTHKHKDTHTHSHSHSHSHAQTHPHARTNTHTRQGEEATHKLLGTHVPPLGSLNEMVQVGGDLLGFLPSSQ